VSVVDVHQHLWPAQLRAALAVRSEPPFLRDGTLVLPQGGACDVDPSAYAPETLVRQLDRHGVDVAVVSCPPTMELPPSLVELWHEGALRAAAASGGRLVPLACRACRPGFAGAIVAGRELDDLGALAPLLDALEEEGRLLFVHPGPAAPPPGRPVWWTPGVPYAAEQQAAFAAWIAEGASRWPRLEWAA
jgi:hypothetical protein